MVCFLSCFGLTKKQKRRRKTGKPTYQVQGGYVPLDSEIKHDAPDPETSFSRNACKEPLALKVKKKVSFNLNVKTYEPLQQVEIDEGDFSDGEEKINWDYPSDYRYYNCKDSFDEYDEIKLEESELEEDYIDDYDDDDDDDVLSQEEFSNQFTKDEDEQKSRILFSASCESNQRTRNRSQYVNSVLNPVENLTQWKMVKAREGTKVNNQKENIRTVQEDQKPSFAKSPSDPLALKYKHNMSGSNLQVDASLSNWLIASEKNPPPKAVTLQKWASC